MIVELNSETERLVQEEVANGHFESASEMVAYAVRALPRDASPAVRVRKRLIDVLALPPFAGSGLDLERQNDVPLLIDL